MHAHELRRLLTAEGWQRLRIESSHHVYGCGSLRLVFAVHGSRATVSAARARAQIRRAIGRQEVAA